MSAAIAFLIGAIAYYKLRSVEAKWVWVLGVCGFALRVMHPTALTIQEESLLFTLGLVSVRAVCYSLGALGSELLLPLVISRPANQPPAPVSSTDN